MLRPSTSCRAAAALLTTVALLGASASTSAQAQTAAGSAGDEPTTARVWLTVPSDENVRLTEQTPLTFAPGTSDPQDPDDISVTIDPSTTYQTIVGFGASLTGSAASLMDDSPERDQMMTALFDTSKGIGLSWLRQPIGASDFIDPAQGDPDQDGFYSYDDVAAGDPDPTLAHFSIAHDATTTIPLVKQALAINPQISVMLTPWSAPAWMKTNASLVGGGDGGPAPEGTLLDDDTSVYADYLVRSVQAYEALGIPVSYLSVQNEPDYSPAAYPGMRLTSTREADVINQVGPKLAQAGLGTKILALDHNWDLEQYARDVLNSSAGQYVDGVAWHGYSDASGISAMSRVHDDYDDYDVGQFFTEMSGTTSVDHCHPDESVEDCTFRNTLWWHTHFFGIQSMRSWAKSMSLWNMALDDDFGPHPDGVCDNCTGVLTVHSDGTFTPNAEYYALGHFSKFVRPGAVRIASQSSDPGLLETVAFRNPNGSTVLVAHTLGGTPETFTATVDGRRLTYTLPWDGVATIVWGGDSTDPDDPAAPAPTEPEPPVVTPPVTPPTTPPTTAPVTPTPQEPTTRPRIRVRTKPRLTIKKRRAHHTHHKHATYRTVKKKTRARVGDRLRVTHGRFRPKHVAVRYRWLRDGTKIRGKKAKKRRYTVRRKDRGARLRVRVTVKKKGYRKHVVTTRTVKVRGHH